MTTTASDFSARLRAVLTERGRLRSQLARADKRIKGWEKQIRDQQQAIAADKRRLQEIDAASENLEAILDGKASVARTGVHVSLSGVSRSGYARERPLGTPVVPRSSAELAAPRPVTPGTLRDRILKALDEKGTTKGSDLALELGASLGSVQATLSELTAEGHVQRVALGSYRLRRDADPEHEEFPPETPEDRLSMREQGLA